MSTNHRHQLDCSAPTNCMSHKHTCRICGVTIPAGTPITLYNWNDHTKGCAGDEETKS